MSTKCPKCGYVRQATDTAPDYECPKCGIIYAKFNPRPVTPPSREDLARQRQAEERARLRKLETLPLTTTHSVPGREVESIVEIVSAECAYGMNLFKDFFTNITDTIGGRSGSVQNTLRDARRKVMSELRAEAFALGADAVIGVDLDYSEFSGAGKSMLFVVATGTAVKLAPASA